MEIVHAELIMGIIKALTFGTGGALVAWHIAGNGNSGLTSLLGCFILFNAISFAASLKK